jgi:ATP-dependent Clp protease ATP-binding subunit ClpA
VTKPLLHVQVIGRDEEIRRCVRVLCRRTKNNPVLIGEPGVGKTAIVESLAQRVVSKRALLPTCSHTTAFYTSLLKLDKP